MSKNCRPLWNFGIADCYSGLQYLQSKHLLCQCVLDVPNLFCGGTYVVPYVSRRQFIG